MFKRLFLASILALLFAGSAAQADDTVSIRGDMLFRGGTPWVPKGVVVTGLVCAARTSTNCSNVYRFATSIWGPREIDAIKKFGADSVNLKVAQPAVDPQGPGFDQAYVDRVVGAVHDLRAAGLVVIVSLDHGTQTGFVGQPEMADQTTARAWRFLAPLFRADQGIMLQVFDEPCAKTDDPASWREWQVGHQESIDAIRSVGAQNVLIVEGLRCGKWLTHVPRLTDPLNQVAFGIHPYPYRRSGQNVNPEVSMLSDQDFDRQFGGWQAAGHVLIATEWNIGANSFSCYSGQDGLPSGAEITSTLFRYLQKHRIGLYLWAMDLPSTVWVGRTMDKPTSVVGMTCDQWQPSGAGAMAYEYFHTGEIKPE